MWVGDTLQLFVDLAFFQEVFGLGVCLDYTADCDVFAKCLVENLENLSKMKGYLSEVALADHLGLADVDGLVEADGFDLQHAEFV